MGEGVMIMVAMFGCVDNSKSGFNCCGGPVGSDGGK